MIKTLVCASLAIAFCANRSVAQLRNTAVQSLATPFDPEHLAPILRPQECVLAYRIVGGRLTATVVSHGDPDPLEFDLGDGLLRRVLNRIDRWRAWITKDPATTTERENLAAHADSHALFETLFPRELLAAVDDAERLLVIPDPTVADLPFESLVTRLPEPGKPARYLLEMELRIAYAPSPLTFLWARSHRGEIEGRPAKHDIVAVATPQRLREAQATTAHVPQQKRQLFSTATDATRTSVLAAATNARVVHFAVDHETSREVNNRLLLTAADEIEMSDVLLNWDFECTELVVLSGNSTNIGRVNRGRIVALPYALFYSGVPAVVATLTDIEPDSARRLMQDFHLRHTGGIETVDALHAAKLRMFAKHPHPRHWAPFVALGDPR